MPRDEEPVEVIDDAEFPATVPATNLDEVGFVEALAIPQTGSHAGGSGAGSQAAGDAPAAASEVGGGTTR